MSDLISRQAAIDALDFEIVHMTAYCDGKNEGNPLAQYNKGLEDGKKAIEALPPAQPSAHQERMRGRWVPVTNGRGGYECDQCHNYAPSYQDGVEWLSDFCPNCGALMDGEVEGRKK